MPVTSLYSACVVPVTSLYSACVVAVTSVYSACIVPVTGLYSACIVPVTSLYGACAVAVTVSTMCINQYVYFLLTGLCGDNHSTRCSSLQSHYQCYLL